MCRTVRSSLSMDIQLCGEGKISMFCFSTRKKGCSYTFLSGLLVSSPDHYWYWSFFIVTDRFEELLCWVDEICSLIIIVLLFLFCGMNCISFSRFVSFLVTNFFILIIMHVAEEQTRFLHLYLHGYIDFIHFWCRCVSEYVVSDKLVLKWSMSLLVMSSNSSFWSK